MRDERRDHAATKAGTPGAERIVVVMVVVAVAFEVWFFFSGLADRGGRGGR